MLCLSACLYWNWKSAKEITELVELVLWSLVSSQLHHMYALNGNTKGVM